MLYFSQLAAGLTCGLSCLAAGCTIGIIGDVGVRGVGLTAERGRKWYHGEEMFQASGGGDDDGEGHVAAHELITDAVAQENSNKLYVGMLIMLIFSEALALYGLIVALILSQHNYICA